MPYAKQIWSPGPDGRTPISAPRLNHIEEGIASRADAVHTHLPTDVTGFEAAVDDRIRDTMSNLRGSRWYLSNSEHWDYGDVVGMIPGDVFMYANSRDLFQYNGSSWIWSGTLAA
ncbi:hypothetical protein [Prescottella agglutinans]|uniref:Uncharacterized protein n=1 Tax=Prescottella agglutinans TaxID=1644129 RepID=A0ABT6MHA7_9NOCA|nr:hypothetical protein [Prescottella agglutinans]MDH6283244.1 hypothetical protein [Prescottella agglutinans]